MSLSPKRRGPPLGHRRLIVAQENFVNESIDAWAKRGERLPLSWIGEERERRGAIAKLPRISRGAIAARLRDRGIESWRTRLRKPEMPRADVGLRATKPRKIVQIDQTLVDVMFVDASRRPIGRPWIAVAFIWPSRRRR